MIKRPASTLGGISTATVISFEIDKKHFSKDKGKKLNVILDQGKGRSELKRMPFECPTEH